ncbi:polyhydroxyalkanoate granule-associated phasin [Caldimonas sp. KR1-144]|uniref:polyhydroxyalkanoate granule-associated phasin n=1 Tax=Caldimonas sp. KR1-144 TaxID=3400911 RepID=UPI003C05BDEB
MPRRRRIASPAQQRLARQAIELSVAAPLVVAQRMARMAAAGTANTLSARDRREFTRMGSEKLQAFQESWQAMGLQAWRAQFTFAQAWMADVSRLWLGGVPFVRWPDATPWAKASARWIGAGLAPVHRRAVANARRLGRGG